MYKYAVVNASGVVVKLTDFPNGRSTLPIQDMEVGVDTRTHRVKRNPKHKWRVRNDYVQITYDIQELDLETQRKKLLKQVKQLNHAAEKAGVTCKSQGETLTLGLDQHTQYELLRLSMLFDADPSMTSTDWEYAPSKWVSVNREKLKFFTKKLAKRVSKITARHRELTESINGADTLHDLSNININAGWP